MTILLDSSACSRLIGGHRSIVTLCRASASVLVSAIVVGEFLLGFRLGSRFEHNLDDLREFLGDHSVTVLPVTGETAAWYGRVGAGLRRKGRPIPTNDMWIAAHAMEHGAELVTFDRHFEAIDGLALTLLSS